MWAGFFLVVLIGSSVFQNNALRTVDSGFFDSFDRFSQGLVTGNIIAHAEGVAYPTWNLGFITINGVTKQSDETWEEWHGFVHDRVLISASLQPYVSQYGIQGVIFLKLYQLFDLKEKADLQLFNSVAFSLVITLLTFLFSRAYDWRFAVVFFLVMITSPWVVSFARNLYWVPFTWFLPAVFATLAYLSKTTLTRALCLFGVGAAVFLKSLAGYEYLSNITLFACAVFVIAPFFRQHQPRHRFNLALGGLAFVACLLGFACALLIHAGMRGETIAQGLVNILEQDVKRRTYGDPSHFDAILRESLTVPVSDVIAMYWNHWATPVVTGIGAGSLNLASAFVLLGLLYSLLKKRTVGLKVLVVLAVYFLASISWFVAAKAHSWIHTQLNFVLWYFGFIQALGYAVVSMAVLLAGDFLAWLRNLSRRGKYLLAGSVAAALLVMQGVTEVLRSQRFDQELSERIATATDSVELGNGFKLVLLKDGEPLLIAARCDDIDPSATLKLRLLPDAPWAAEQTLEVPWAEHAVVTPVFSTYNDNCMTYLPRIDMRIKRLDISQYRSTDQQPPKVLWERHADLSGKRYLRTLTAVNFTDGNWNKGIHRSAPAFLLPTSFATRQSLAFGDVVDMGAAGKRTINGIAYSEEYVTVYVEGAPLDTKQSGFPKTLGRLPK